MACQVSGAVVSAVSAMTVQLGRKIAPVIVEKGGKVSYLYLLFLFFHLLFLFSLLSPPSIVFQWKACKITCHILSQSCKTKTNRIVFTRLLPAGMSFLFLVIGSYCWRSLIKRSWPKVILRSFFGHQIESESAIEVVFFCFKSFYWKKVNAPASFLKKKVFISVELEWLNKLCS